MKKNGVQTLVPGELVHRRLCCSPGFTLMELMVYIAIMGIIVIVAGQAFSDSTKMRIRTQSMLRANEAAGNIAMLMKDDIAQMGAKSGKDESSTEVGKDKFFFKDSVYMDPLNTQVDQRDSSSFILTKDNSGTNQDKLVFRRVAYDDAGKYKRIEEIAWYITDRHLYRSCKTVRGTADADLCPSDEEAVVEIADNIEKFIVTPSKPGVLNGNKIVFPANPADLSDQMFRLIPRSDVDNLASVTIEPMSASRTITMKGFITNYQVDGGEVLTPTKHQVFVLPSTEPTNEWNRCKKITFKKDSTYEISFEMDNNSDESRMFRPNIDHFSLGLRQVDAGEALPVPQISDYYFYPPENESGVGTRRMKIKPSVANVDACLAFNFVFYSPSVSRGSITIKDLKVERIGDMDYKFEAGYSPALVDKKNVRAMQVEVELKSNGEAGRAVIAIPVPSNGTRG